MSKRLPVFLMLRVQILIYRYASPRMVSRGSARYICLTAFPQTRTLVSGNHVGKFDITSLFAPQMNGRFRYDIRLYFSCEAHIESVRTYRARSAYRSPQANIDAHLRCAKSQFNAKTEALCASAINNIQLPNVTIALKYSS